MRLAVLQSPAELDGVAARLDWLAGHLPDLSAQRVDLALLPELFACGYNIGADLPARAEARNGPTAQKIAALAKAHRIALHYGYAERAEDGLYNAAQCFGADGGRLVHQRKLAIPSGWERGVFAPGSGTALFTCAGLKVATLICYDAEFPEAVRHVAAKGAQLVLAPTALSADWAWVAGQMIPTRGYENGVYLAYANQAGVERGMSYLGHSVIAAPDGSELARAGPRPEVLLADLDAARVDRAQARLPYLTDRARLRLD